MSATNPNFIEPKQIVFEIMKGTVHEHLVDRVIDKINDHPYDVVNCLMDQFELSNGLRNAIAAKFVSITNLRDQQTTMSHYIYCLLWHILLDAEKRRQKITSSAMVPVSPLAGETPPPSEEIITFGEEEQQPPPQSYFRLTAGPTGELNVLSLVQRRGEPPSAEGQIVLHSEQDDNRPVYMTLPDRQPSPPSNTLVQRHPGQLVLTQPTSKTGAIVKQASQLLGKRMGITTRAIKSFQYPRISLAPPHDERAVPGYLQLEDQDQERLVQLTNEPQEISEGDIVPSGAMVIYKEGKSYAKLA